MNIYHAWCDLKPGVSDIAFSEGASKYLTHLQAKGMIESWRITRRKLGLAQRELGEFHLIIEVKDLAQLDRAFDHVAERSEPTEGFPFWRQLPRAKCTICALSRFSRSATAARRRAVLVEGTSDTLMSASLIGRLGSSTFRAIHQLQRRCRSRARASLRTRHQGPSIMGFEDEVEQSYGRPCRHCNGRFKPTYELTSSIVPRGTSFHRWVDLRSSPILFDFVRFSRRGDLPGPPELGAINPDAVHDHRQPTRQCHDRLFHPPMPGDLHRPGPEPGPFR